MKDLELLKELCLAHGPSGFEEKLRNNKNHLWQSGIFAG